MKGKGSFAAGALTLAVSGILVRLIGACYRIPMTNLIGEEGIALYQYAYPVFGMMLALTTAGIPPAMARAVSEHISRGEEGRALRVFYVCLTVLSLVGLMGAAALWWAAPMVARWMGDTMAELPLKATAPAVFFVSVLSAYRGYFQGQQRMLPTAATQIVEQLGKLIMGLGLALELRERGPEYAAAGALLGMAASELFALIGLMFVKKGRKTRGPAESAASVMARILPTALPLMGGAILMPLVGMADSFVVNRRLMEIGYSAVQARGMYGLMTGPVHTLINMPSVIPMAISTALVPAAAQACARKNWAEVQRKTEVSLKLTLVFSMGAAVLMASLAEPLMQILYSALLPEKQMAAAGMLRMTAPAVVMLALAQVLSGVLQGMGRAKRAAASLGAGVVVKILTTYALTGNLRLNITGACIGTVVCYSMMAVMSLWNVGRILQRPVGSLKLVMGPVTAAGIMAWGMELVLKQSASFLPLVQILLATPVGMGLYGAGLWLTGSITKDEIRSMTGRGTSG